jgi:outer membrane protein assembly factor BamB
LPLQHPAALTPRIVGLCSLLVAAAVAGCRRTPPTITAEPEVEPLPGTAELQAHDHHADAAPAPVCGADPWTTYAHDAARTSASGGCLAGPLHLSWTFAPRSSTGAPSFATRAIADADAVYVAGALGPVPTLWRLGASDGKPAWTYDSHTEAVRGGWPTLAGGRVYLVDDGVNEADAVTGAGHRAELDAWGESLSDGEHLFAENDWYLDGYGLYLSAFDRDLKLLWRRDYNALARGVMVPDVGGLAFGGGLLVHAAQHGPLTGSGLSAFDPATGERRWRVTVSPFSSPSVAGGRVYAIERWPDERSDRLVSRQLADGTLAWARPLAGARGPAPVLAGRLAVVHTSEAVVAFDQASGERVWSAPLPRSTPDSQSATTLAAATGSGTLAVISGAQVHLLRLDDGTALWADAPVPHAKRLEGPVVTGRSLLLVADGHVVRLDGAEER